MSEYDAQAGRNMPPDPLLSEAQNDAVEHDVFVAVQHLAGLVADVDDLESVLGHIAEFAMSAVPGADGAGVTLVSAVGVPPPVLAWAVTAPFVREIDHLQYDVCGEGPCLTAMQTGRTVLSGALGSDNRWPSFGSRVARMGVQSALSLALLVRDSVVGALNIYARGPDAFTEHAVRLAEQFARPAAVSVGNIQTLQAAHTRASQLQAALTSRAVIDQAIGIIRSRTGGTAAEAFDRLRHISQTENVKLTLVAQRMVDEAVRRAHARHG